MHAATMIKHKGKNPKVEGGTNFYNQINKRISIYRVIQGTSLQCVMNRSKTSLFDWFKLFSVYNICINKIVHVFLICLDRQLITKVNRIKRKF